MQSGKSWGNMIEKKKPVWAKGSKPGKQQGQFPQTPLCISERILLSSGYRRAPLLEGCGAEEMTYLRGRSESPPYTCHFSDSFSIKFSKWQGAILCMFWTSLRLNTFLLKQRLFESLLCSQHLLYGNNRMNTVWIPGPAHWSLFTSLGVKLCHEMCASQTSEPWERQATWQDERRRGGGERAVPSVVGTDSPWDQWLGNAYCYRVVWG